MGHASSADLAASGCDDAGEFLETLRPDPVQWNDFVASHTRKPGEHPCQNETLPQPLPRAVEHLICHVLYKIRGKALSAPLTARDIANFKKGAATKKEMGGRGNSKQLNLDENVNYKLYDGPGGAQFDESGGYITGSAKDDP